MHTDQSNPAEPIVPSPDLPPNLGIPQPHGKLDHPQVRPTPEASSRKISVALGGGGARGLAHLGVMKAIEESTFEVDHISGTSIGALAGAMVATRANHAAVEGDVLEFIASPAFQKRQKQMAGSGHSDSSIVNPAGWIRRLRKVISVQKTMTRALRGVAVLPESTLRHAIDSLIPDVNIEDLETSLSIVAVDILSGQRVVITEGSLRNAVRASASIPGVFPPVPWDNMLLADIGVYESIPTITAKQYGSDLTLAVDVSHGDLKIDGCRNILEVFHRVQELAEHQIRQHALHHADHVVRPTVGRRGRFDFSMPEQVIEIGYKAATQTLSQVAATTA